MLPVDVEPSLGARATSAALYLNADQWLYTIKTDDPLMNMVTLIDELGHVYDLVYWVRCHSP